MEIVGKRRYNLYILKRKDDKIVGFMQVTLGDVIGYIIMLSGFAITISLTVKVKYSSHDNKKNVTKVNQSKSKVKGDQIGGDKR